MHTPKVSSDSNMTLNQIGPHKGNDCLGPVGENDCLNKQR